MPVSRTLLRRPPGWLRPSGRPVLDATDSVNVGLTSHFIFGVGLNDLTNRNQPALIAASATTYPTSITPLGRLAACSSTVYFQIAQAPAVLDTPAMSVSLWLVATTAVTTQYTTIFAQGYDGTTEPRYLDCRNNLSGDAGTSACFLVFADFNASTAIGALSTLDLNLAASVNKLFHIVGTSDGVTAQIFVNGRFNASGAAQPLSSNAKPFNIGYLDLNGTDDRMFTGNIDNVRTYSRVLTPGEVARLYVDPWAGLIFPNDAIWMMALGPQAQNDLIILAGGPPP